MASGDNSHGFGDPMQKPGRWNRYTVLVFEGGGTRGYASLKVLDALMLKIAEIERNHDVPHYSSFETARHNPRQAKSCHASPKIPGDIDDHSPRTLDVPPCEGDAFGNGESSRQPPSTPPHRERHSSMLRAKVKEMEQQKAEERRPKEEGLYLPCHYFDYIAGTSTGGLTALALGRLRMSSTEFLRCYKQIARNVFGHWRPHLYGVVGPARYDGRYLEEAIKLLVKQHTTPDREFHEGEQPRASLQLMRSPPDLCKTVVVSKQESLNRSKKTTYLFRSFPNPERSPPAELHRNPGDATACHIWEAGRATSAAPTYLEPIQIDGNLYSDGGEGCNDPSFEVYRDIDIVAGYNPREPSTRNQHPVRLFLTFGTGLKEPRAHRLQVKIRRMFHQWKHEVVDNPETVETTLSHLSRIGDFSYFKFLKGNVELGKIDLDKCKEKHFTRMNELVERYLQEDEVKNKLEETAKELVRIRRERLESAREHLERFARCTYFVCKVPGSDCQKMVGTRGELLAHLKQQHEISIRPEFLEEAAFYHKPRDPQVFRGPK